MPVAEGDVRDRAAEGQDAEAQRIRETAKWLCVAFGAVGAALIGGLQLTSIAELDSESRRLALVGFAVAIVAVTVGVLATAVVMTGGRVHLADLEPSGPQRFGGLRNRLNARADLRGGQPSIGDLAKSFDEALRARADARRAWRASRAEPDEQAYKEANDEHAEVSPWASRLIDAARLEALAHTWSRGRWWVAGAALVAAAGAACFAVALHGKTGSVLDKRPVLATVTLTDAGNKNHAGELSRACIGEHFQAVATASTEASVAVVALPAAKTGCEPVALTLQRGEAEATRLSAVSLAALPTAG